MVLGVLEQLLVHIVLIPFNDLEVLVEISGALFLRICAFCPLQIDSLFLQLHFLILMIKLIVAHVFEQVAGEHFFLLGFLEADGKQRRQ